MHKFECTCFHFVFMALYKPGKRQLVNGVDNKQDSKESHQAFELHTLWLFTFLSPAPESREEGGFSGIFKDGKDRVLEHNPEQHAVCFFLHKKALFAMDFNELKKYNLLYQK